MFNSHEEYGFKEPIYTFYYEFTGRHGISDIEINYFKENDVFFVAVLAGNVLYEVDVNLENEDVNKIQTYRTNERIRDIEFDKENNVSSSTWRKYSFSNNFNNLKLTDKI